MGKSARFVSVSGVIEQRNYFPFYNYEYELDVTAQNKLMPDLLPLGEGLKRSYEWYKSNRGAVNIKNYFDFIERNLIAASP
ncbi:MAG: hypothetical protein HDP34_01055 [Clostridia bacterium]|nr:hypothetical protein [Clostridia bacterium]